MEQDNRTILAALAGQRFVASFSGGKDSTLALHRARQAGMVPMRLITTWNTDAGRSWFHGLPEPILADLADAWGIPVTLMKTSGPAYTANFERQLAMAAAEGATFCVFGDIDLEAHRVWCTERCVAAGMSACFPLWRENRRELVFEFLDAGFRTVITTVDTGRLPEHFVGRRLDRETVAAIEACGADACGEEGEYHTFVFDGPGLAHPIAHRLGGLVRQDQYAMRGVLPAIGSSGGIAGGMGEQRESALQ